MVHRSFLNLIVISLIALISCNSWGYCLLSFDPKTIEPASCPGIDSKIFPENLTLLRDVLDKLYHSRDVQSSGAHCAKMADLVQAVCRSKKMITSFFNSSDSVKTQRVAMVTTSTDYRLVPPILATPASSYLNPGLRYIDVYTCNNPGKTAISLTPTCGIIYRCETRRNYVFPKEATVKLVNGQLVGYASDGTILERELVVKNQVIVSHFFGSCNDVDTKYADIYDQIYVSASPLSANPKTPPAVPFCSSTSTSCTKYDVPLLSQNSVDLLRLVSKKTRIAHPQDAGFCAPTTMAMLLTGLKKQSNSFFGDVIDSGASYKDSVDGITASNWAGAVFRAGQLIGTDWWVGGTSNDENRSVLLNGFGKAAGTLDSFMGTKNGYTNANLINFTNQFGGLVQMTLAMDSTTPGKDGSYHSVLVAGHSGGHLRVMDPWGRAYLVDMNIQSRDAVFIILKPKLFQASSTIIDDGKQKLRRIYMDMAKPLIWEIPTTLVAGDKVPSWFFTLPNQSTYLDLMQKSGYITLEHRLGTEVPTLKHLSGDQGFVYYSPSQQSQLLPGTEVAAVNPGQGVYFDAAESQNNLDMLYGFGQRIRAFSYVTKGREPTDAEFASATQTIKALDGWIGAALQSSAPKETTDSIKKRLSSVTGVTPSDAVISAWLGTGLLGNNVVLAARNLFDTISLAYKSAYNRLPSSDELNRWMAKTEISYQEITNALDLEKKANVGVILSATILDE